MSYYEDVLYKARTLGKFYDGEPRNPSSEEVEIFVQRVKMALSQYADGVSGDDADQVRGLVRLVWVSLEQSAAQGFDFTHAWRLHLKDSRMRWLVDIVHELAHPTVSFDAWVDRKVDQKRRGIAKAAVWKAERSPCPDCADVTVPGLRRFHNEMSAIADDSAFWKRVWRDYNGDLQAALRARVDEALRISGTPDI